MKRRWIRKLAVLLVVCLLMNNSIEALPIWVQAVGMDESAASVTSGDANVEADGDVDVGKDVMEDVPEEVVPEQAEEGSDEIMSTVSQGNADRPMQSMLPSQGLQTVSASDIALMNNGSGHTMPSTVAEYTALKDQGVTTLYISTYDDFIDAQNLCKQAAVGGFADMTIIVASPTGADTGGIWDLANLDGFDGIGTQSYPFKGTMNCGYGQYGGVQLQLDTPLFGSMGGNAKLHDINLLCIKGHAVISEYMQDTVTLSDITLGGEVYNSSNSGPAGVIAGTLSNGCKVTLTRVVTNGAMTVQGGFAGAIAGAAGDNVQLTLGEGVAIGSAGAEVTVTTGYSSGSVGGYFGSLQGRGTWNLADNSKLAVRLEGSKYGYVGYYAAQLRQGTLSNGVTTGELSIIGGNALEVNITGQAAFAGGIVAQCGTNTKITLPEGGLTIGGLIDVTTEAGYQYVGALCGRASDTESMEFSDLVVSASLKGSYSNGYVGGLIGKIDGGGKFIVRNTTISGTVSAPKRAGGLVGGMEYTSNKSPAMELQGAISVASLSGSERGLIAAYQNKALIYFSEVEGLLAGNSQLVVPDTLRNSVNEVDESGGVFRNQSVAGGRLIGDGTLEKVGVINHTVTKTGDDYELATAADFVTLAIALGTEGIYGLTNNVGGQVFAEATQDDELLNASYLVTNSVDISYEKTGIVTLNRNAYTSAAYAFGGSMRGITPDITITQNISVKQDRQGLFSTLKGNVTFENLTFAGKISKASGVGGIAYQSIGTGLTLKNITMQRTMESNSGTIGGVLALLYNDSLFTLTVDKLTLANQMNVGSTSSASGFITTMEDVRFSMSDIVLGGSYTYTGTSSSSGMLGRAWTKVGGSLDGLTVLPDTSFNNKGSFGVLCYSMTNRTGERVTLKDVKLKNLTVNASSSISNNGLLLRDATDMVLELIDYDSTGCVVTGAGSEFDEIAGRTSYPSSSNPIVKTGIISIHNTQKMYPEYHYENKVAALANVKNPETMYFYDLFQHFDNNGSPISFDGRMDNEAEVLLWDVIHYAYSDTVRSVFTPYCSVDVSNYYWENFTLVGELDLSKISFYPIINCGGYYTGEDAVLKFDATAYDMQNWKLNPKTDCQHYGLQAGLFYNATNAMNINAASGSLTLTGRVTNMGKNSGALVGGEKGAANGGVFKNITLDNLWLHGYTNGATTGLLISNIPTGAATFDGIHMVGYEGAGDAKAAAALIGSAGGSEEKNLKLNFHDMVIADDRDSIPTAELHNGKVLAYASFLYNYNYINDASINKGYGLYLFSEADDTAGKVTYGEELDYETEFSDNSKKVFDPSEPEPSTLYKPYVYQTRQIEVNPKSGDILKGCGTYEDPYIIENAKQFLTLYRYINDTGTPGNYQYQTFYQGWRLVQTGDDSSFCATKHNVTVKADNSLEGVGAEDVKVFGVDEDFPTPEALSQAYFRLEKDIDLSQKLSATYAKIAEDFVGFGLENRPFMGVWYGKGEDGTVHTITLPNKTSDPYATYGFIQFARGAVIKDIKIRTSGTDGASLNTSITARVDEIGGGVIAVVMGGDNIIDNVTVEMDLYVCDANSVVGGYVGKVKKGGVILRNVSDTALAKFRMNKTPDTSTTATSYVFLGAVVGKVEDGYVICEGLGNTTNVWTGAGGSTMAQAGNYVIPNGDKLKAGSTGLTFEKVDKQITITVPTAEALQVMSMALNADALNIRPSDYSSYKDCGYTNATRSRKATYNDIGCTDSACADYVFAAKYDNVTNYTQNGYAHSQKAFAYPYLFRYMGITEDEYLDWLIEVGGKPYSILNTAILLNGTAYPVQWNLAENGSYDMSVYSMGFRGLGALYGAGVKYGGAFNGNFDGKNSTIKIDMTKKHVCDEKNNEDVARVALFNTLYGRDAALYQMPVDFKDIGVAESNIINCAEIKNLVLTGKITVQGAVAAKVEVGGIAAQISDGQIGYVFDNIVIKSFEVDGNNISSKSVINRAGGISGFLGNDANICIRNCSIQGTDLAHTKIKAHNNAGGFVGLSYAKLLKFVNTTAEYMTVTSDGTNAGGFVGGESSATTRLICEGTAERNCSVANSTINGHERAGGLIGEARCPISMAYVTVDGVSLQAFSRMAGVVAGTEGTYTSKLEHVSVKDVLTTEKDLYMNTETGIGGVIGKNQQNLTLKDVKVSGSLNEGVYSCRLHALSYKTRRDSNGTGGIVGTHIQGTLRLEDCSVDTVSISTDISASNSYIVEVSAGGLVGDVRAPIVLDGSISATNLKVSAPLKSKYSKDDSSAGGCFGFLYGMGTSDATNGSITGVTEGKYYKGLTATGNIVTGRWAGGLVGYAEGSNTGIYLTGATVKNGIISSDDFAGGMFGQLKTCAKGSGIHNTAGSTVSNMQITGRMAGGLIGDLTLGGSLSMDSISLLNNTVIARQLVASKEYSAGGIIGSYSGTKASAAKLMNMELKQNIVVCEVTGATLSDSEKDFPAVGGVVGRIYDTNAIEPTELLCDNITLSVDNKLGLRQSGSDAVQLVCKVGDTYQLTDISVPAQGAVSKDYEAIQSLVQDYGYYVGNMVGVLQSTNVQFYMLRSNDTDNKFETPIISVNSPVTDVGRTSGQNAEAYRSYCHIIYGAEVAKAKQMHQNALDMKTEVDKTCAAYDGSKGKDVLKEYRLSAEQIELFQKLYRESYTFPGTDITINQPIFVYRAEYGTLQDSMECLVDVMTNVAGISATDIDSRYLSITCAPKLGLGSSSEDGEGAVSLTTTMQDGQTSYSSPQYDGIREGKLSYTEITFTYGWSDHQKVFKLPIFVEEPILYSIHMTVAEDKVVDASKVKAEGVSEAVGQVIMANDSDYTMLLEYSYGKARKNMPDSTVVDKIFYLEALNAPKNMAVGNRYILIDVTNGNKAYYYTVESDNVSQINFTDFKDSAGNAYVNRPINALLDMKDPGKEYYTDLGGHQLTETGVERFLLTVLAAENTDNMVYTMHAGIQIEDPALRSVFYPVEEHAEEAVLSVKAVPGLSITLSNKGTDTDIAGIINQDGSLKVKAQIMLRAKDNLYWVEKNNALGGAPMIDSSNNGKYLELAFYLRDTSSNRVRFPSGTNFSYKLGENTDAYSEKKVIQNDSVVYYYKDIRDVFEQESEYKISALTENKTINLEFLLDFSGADLDSLTDDSYYAWLDLLRSPNKDYPMGNGNELDDYHETVDASAGQQLGFAVRARDLNQLAINTYPQVQNEDLIDYNVMFDFSKLLAQTTGAGLTAVLNKWSGYDYTVTYQLYQKVENASSVVYEKYTGNDIVLTSSNGVSATESVNGTMQVVYRFSKEQLQESDGFLTFPGSVTIDTDVLTEDLTKLTNYKVEAKLVITEGGVGAQPGLDTVDFFVYTITRLKTDL